jgi:hypothetical protein
MPLPEFIELNGRLHQVTISPGPLMRDGVLCDCYVNPDEQTIEIGDEVHPDDREAVLVRAVNETLRTAGDPWRIVPVIS